MRIKGFLVIFKCASACALLAHFRSFATYALPKVTSRAQIRCFVPYLRPSFSALESYTFISVEHFHCKVEAEPVDAQKITRDAKKITFSQPCVILSLYAPYTCIWYSKKRRKQLLPSKVKYLAHHLFGVGRLVHPIYECARGGTK